MMETRQIVALWRRQIPAARGVLVTLVHAEGSSYRRPGARLLIVESGETAGTISGGCLEAEVLRKAFWKVRNGPVLETYSTTFDDSSEIPYGLGCGGTVELLLEPSGTPEFDALLSALEASLLGQASGVTTLLPRSGLPLQRIVQTSTVFASQNLSPESTSDPRAFTETLLPPQRLVVLGAGEDARPLVALAALLGWRILVADGRSNLVKPDRFPAAERVLSLPPDTPLAPLAIQSEDAVILMTHSFYQDRDLLTALLPLAPRYLGLLGARHRSSLLVKESAQQAGLTVEQACDRIFAPVGLDLGGDGPQAIALAILAEIQAVCAGRRVISRRLSAADVAAQIEAGGSAPYPESHCALDLPA